MQLDRVVYTDDDSSKIIKKALHPIISENSNVKIKECFHSAFDSMYDIRNCVFYGYQWNAAKHRKETLEHVPAWCKSDFQKSFEQCIARNAITE